MFCSVFSAIALLLTSLIGGGPGSVSTAQDATSPAQSKTIVYLCWVRRAGVSRYRLQLARDSGFSNIVLDRVVQGSESELSDLEAGRYFWRVAPLTTKLGSFSCGGPIEIKPTGSTPATAKSEINANAITTPVGWCGESPANTRRMPVSRSLRRNPR